MKVVSELGSAQRVHGPRERTACQEINALAAQLSSARTCQNKSQFPRLNESMHFVEQVWDTLDLINENPLAELWRDHLGQALGFGIEQLKMFTTQKIDRQGRWKLCFDPVRLSGAARSKEKKTLALWRLKNSRIHK